MREPASIQGQIQNEGDVEENEVVLVQNTIPCEPCPPDHGNVQMEMQEQSAELENRKKHPTWKLKQWSRNVTHSRSQRNQTAMVVLLSTKH